MVERMLWNPLERVLWGVTITILLISGLQYLHKGRKREDFIEKIMMFGWASFIISIAFFWIFVCLRDFQYPGIFRNGTFYLDIPFELTQGQADMVMLFVHCANLSLFVGFALLFLAFDYLNKSTKFITFSISFAKVIIYIIFAIILKQLHLLIFTINPISITWAIIYYLQQFSLFFLLYYVTKWAQVEFKAVTSLFFFKYNYNSRFQFF